MNGDGRADLFVGAGRAPGPVAALLSGRDGAVLLELDTYPTDYATGGASSSAGTLGDLDGDRIPDFFHGFVNLESPGLAGHLRVHARASSAEAHPPARRASHSSSFSRQRSSESGPSPRAPTPCRPYSRSSERSNQERASRQRSSAPPPEAPPASSRAATRAFPSRCCTCARELRCARPSGSSRSASSRASEQASRCGRASSISRR